MRNMEGNKEYQYAFENTIYALTDNGDYWINRSWHDKWIEVDAESGPHPSSRYKQISEEEALKLALSFGMSEEMFYNI